MITYVSVCMFVCDSVFGNGEFKKVEAERDFIVDILGVSHLENELYCIFC